MCATSTSDRSRRAIRSTTRTSTGEIPNLNISTATPQEIVASVRTGSAQPSNTSPVGRLWKQDKNNFAPRLGFAWDVNGDGRLAVRGGYGLAYERNFGNVTYNVLFNPPLYLVATIDAVDLPGGVQPIYTDNAGPFGGVAGVTKTIPAGSLRHVDQNIKTAYSHIYGVSVTKDIAGLMTGSIEYNGSSGRDLYDLADVNKAGCTARIRRYRHCSTSAAESAVRGIQYARQSRPLAVPQRRVLG